MSTNNSDVDQEDVNEVTDADFEVANQDEADQSQEGGDEEEEESYETEDEEEDEGVCGSCLGCTLDLFASPVLHAQLV